MKSKAKPERKKRGGSSGAAFCSACGKRGIFIRTRHLETADVDVFMCSNEKCKNNRLYFYGPERMPKMDVNDPRWADTFTRFFTRKCARLGMDPIEGVGRMLGLKKESDAWRKRRQAELRHREAHNGDIYGTTPNSDYATGVRISK
jgi:hypothetical protein